MTQTHTAPIINTHREALLKILALINTASITTATGAVADLLREITGGADLGHTPWHIVGACNWRASRALRQASLKDIEAAIALHAGDLIEASRRETERAALERIRAAVNLHEGASPTQIAQAVERLTLQAPPASIVIKRRDAA